MGTRAIKGIPNVEREIATRLWPHHAAMCSDQDWSVLSEAIIEDRPIEETIVTPVGEAKDAMVVSLMILYWTMRIVREIIKIKAEIGDTNSENRKKATIGILSQRFKKIPKILTDKLSEIIDAVAIDDK
jgi:hypothetical protein